MKSNEAKVYTITTDQFEGPLDLLLSLIEERKLDITRLSLAQVADQYLEKMQSSQKATLQNMADFLVIASKLILIKSKALLPTLDLTDEEEEEIKSLEEQLIEYKKFKDASKQIERLFHSPLASFTRESLIGLQTFFSPPANLTVSDLAAVFRKILDEIPEIEKLEEEMVKEVVTLEEKINHLQEILKKRIVATFSEVTHGAQDKLDVIISFLAMLELVKQKVIQVEQKGLFKEIEMKANS